MLLAAALWTGCAASGVEDSVRSGTEAQVTCTDPLPSVTYSEVGTEWGIAGAVTGDETVAAESSLVVADLDGDHDAEIVTSYAGFPSGQAPVGTATVYWNDGSWTPEALPGWFSTPTLADIDRDSLLDFVTGTEHGPTRVAFDPPRFESLFSTSTKAPREVTAADVDGDGALDLYVLDGHGNPEAGDYLLRGDGAGAFQRVDSGVPANLTARYTFDGQWFDWDRDHDLDLVIVNDQGPQFGGNVLLANEGGRLVDRSAECLCGIEHSGMGVDAGDVDGDGILDLYVTAASLSVLLRGSADGRFTDLTAATNADPITAEQGMTWGAVFLDHDNDGRTDVLVAQGDFTGTDHGPVEPWPISLMAQGTDGTFTDVGSALGLATAGIFRTTVATDLNADGVLDLVVGDVLDRPLAYLSDGCTANGWIEVEAPTGAWVEVDAGGTTQTAQVTTESGFAAARDPVVHFGLGANETLDAIRVILLGGDTVVMEGPLPARQRIQIAP